MTSAMTLVIKSLRIYINNTLSRNRSLYIDVAGEQLKRMEHILSEAYHDYGDDWIFCQLKRNTITREVVLLKTKLCCICCPALERSLEVIGAQIKGC
ncbi:hypothetical protein Bca4012_085131 [Brassica carinata]